MKCPECQFENVEGSTFCGKCGSSLELEVVCPNCGSKPPRGYDFCNTCGHDLRQPTEPAPIDYSQPQSYTPKFLADKILTTRSSIEGERKLVTVLFADVANYTSIAEKLDPEEVHQIMDGCFKILMDEIHRYEGTINQFTGDGVMALFGAPVAHEDHGQRACHAALSIQKAIDGYGEKMKGQDGAEFKLRIGLNSGPVIVGSIGDDLRMDYTAIGDTTNLAHRMQDMAEPGAVLVSGHTHRLARDFFEFASLGKVEVKGKEEPQEAYELIRPTEVETRIEAAAAKGLTRFVGRRKEMEALREAFDKAKSGSGQVIGIVGEAGVGKSRLLLEIRGILPEGDYSFLEGRCLHYGGSMPYLPILDVLKAYFDVEEEDREAAIKKKVRTKLRALDDQMPEVPPGLYEILSLQIEDQKYLQLGPQQKREQTFEAIRDLLVRESLRKPLILAVEDLHWIDNMSEAFLDYLIGVLPNMHILLILLYRPEYTHAWGSKSYYSKLGLDHLSTGTSAELVQAILEAGEVAPEIGGLILGRAGGNPLFVEELTHSLLENGSIERRDHQFVLTKRPSEIEVPDTIQGIIAARMDRVEENLKRIMQVASVIGREFTYRILAAITGMAGELKASLLNLQGLEFIYEKQLFPELEYIFKHALTQEVAYNSLLQKRRKEIHEGIGRAIEELYAERLEEYCDLVAYHYSRSGNKQKAVGYLTLANRKADYAGATNEAMAYYDQAMHFLDTLPDSEENRERRIFLLAEQSNMYEMFLKMPEYYALLKRYEPIAEELRDVQLKGGFWFSLGHCQCTFGDFNSAIQTLTRTAESGEAAKNENLTGSAYTVLGWSHLFAGNYDHALTAKKNALRTTEKGLNPISYVRSLAGISWVFSHRGRWDEAETEGRKTLRAAEDSLNASLIAFANSTLAMVYLFKGDLDKAIQHAERGLEKVITPFDQAVLQVFYAGVLVRSGNPGKGIESLSAILQIVRSGRYVPVELYCTCLIGEGARMAGKTRKAKEFLTEGVEVAQRCGARYHLAWALRILGEIALENDLLQAETWFEKSMAIAQEISAENELASAFSGYGRFHKLQGNTEQAREYLTKALEIFERLGTLLEPDKVRGELAQLTDV